MGRIVPLDAAAIARRMHAPVEELIGPEQAAALRALRDRLEAAQGAATPAVPRTAAHRAPPPAPTASMLTETAQRGSIFGGYGRGALISTAIGAPLGLAVGLTAGTDASTAALFVAAPAAMLAAHRFSGIQQVGTFFAVTSFGVAFIPGVVASGALRD